MGLVIASENDDAHRSAFKWRFRNVKFNNYNITILRKCLLCAIYSGISYVQFIVAPGMLYLAELH